MISTSVGKSHLRELRAFHRLGGKVVYDLQNDWSENVTHVVLKAQEMKQTSSDSSGSKVGYSCVPDLKYFFGVVSGKWVVAAQWLDACVKARRFVDAAPFEVRFCGGKPMDGPHEARLQIHHPPKSTRLFAGLSFAWLGPEDPRCRWETQLSRLLKTGGAAVERSVDALLDRAKSPAHTEDPKLTRSMVLVSSRFSAQKHVTHSSLAARLHEACSGANAPVAVVTLDWLFRSIPQYRLLSIDNFRVAL